MRCIVIKHYAYLTPYARKTLEQAGWKVIPTVGKRFELWHPHLQVLPPGLILVDIDGGNQGIRRLDEGPFAGEQTFK